MARENFTYLNILKQLEKPFSLKYFMSNEKFDSQILYPFA